MSQQGHAEGLEIELGLHLLAGNKCKFCLTQVGKTFTLQLCPLLKNWIHGELQNKFFI